jgi:hypothetical protein
MLTVLILTHSMERRKPWEARDTSGQELLNILLTTTVNLCVHKIPPFDFYHSTSLHPIYLIWIKMMIMIMSMGWDYVSELRLPTGLLTGSRGRVGTLLLRIRKVPDTILGPCYRLLWLRFSWFSSVAPGKCQDSALELEHECLLPSLLQFIIIHLSSWHRRYIV